MFGRGQRVPDAPVEVARGGRERRGRAARRRRRVGQIKRVAPLVLAVDATAVVAGHEEADAALLRRLDQIAAERAPGALFVVQKHKGPLRRWRPLHERQARRDRRRSPADLAQRRERDVGARAAR